MQISSSPRILGSLFLSAPGNLQHASLFRSLVFSISAAHIQAEARIDMDPKSDDFGPASTNDPKRKKVFQRRLHNQLSESRMLEVLDRSLQHERPRTAEIGRQSTELGNQEEEEQNTADFQDEEEELVCVSTMVKMGNEEPVKSAQFQAGGVLKTVRNIHRQRALQENQAEH